MQFASSSAEAMQRERDIHVNGNTYTLREYVGSMPLRGGYVEGNEANNDAQPQGFLVWQPPNAVTPPHFHITNQFQVFVSGGGSIGNKDASPMTVQYANGHSPYGPIRSGDEGLHYFTLRQLWDEGAKYLPGERARLEKGNRKTRVNGSLQSSTADERVARPEAHAETIFEPDESGVAGWLWQAGPGQSIDLQSTEGTGGHYIVVAEGSAVCDGKALDRWSVVFQTPQEDSPQMVAGPDGLDLFVLRFPPLPALAA